MSTKEIENLNAKLSELEIKVKVLEKLYDQTLQALAKASVAEKTADKALAMAQEALVIVMKPESSAAPIDYEDRFQGYNPMPSQPQKVRAPHMNGPTDDELTTKLEEAENEFS